MFGIQIVMDHYLMKYLIIVLICWNTYEIGAQVYGNTHSSIQLNCPHRATSSNELSWSYSSVYPTAIWQRYTINELLNEKATSFPRFNVTGDFSKGEYNLVIYNLKKDDAGYYVCTVMRTSTETVQQLVVVDFNGTSAQSVLVKAGSQVQLNCIYTAPIKGGIIIWTFPDPLLPLSENTVVYGTVPVERRQRLTITGDHSNGEYNLLISDIKKTDEGRYECSIYGDPTKVRIQQLFVRESITVSVENKTFNPSDQFRQMYCNASGYQANYSYYKWQHKSMYGTVIRTFDGTSTLSLPQVPEEARYQDTGEYVCIVSNGKEDHDASVYRASGYIVSRALPVFVTGKHQTTLGQYARNVEIQVEVYSIPKYMSAIWIKDVNVISSSTKYNMTDVLAVMTDTFHGTEVHVDGYILTLTIHNLQEQDFVNYTLRLTDALGTSVDHVVVLISASPPDTPVNFTYVDVTETTLTLQWLPGFDGGLEQSFVIENRIQGVPIWIKMRVAKRLQSSKFDLQTHTLTGLQDGASYEIRMYAENEFNKSETTNVLTISTKVKKKSGQVVVIGTVVGCLAGLGIFASIAVLVIRRKRRGHIPNEKPSTPSDSHQTHCNAYPEVYYNITDSAEEKDDNSKLDGCEYERLGTKDRPNEYAALEKKPTDRNVAGCNQNHKSLETQTSHIYLELDQNPKGERFEVEIRTYEEPGPQDIQNSYDVLENKPADVNCEIIGQSYETLGTTDKPSIYEELTRGAKGSTGDTYSNTRI